MEAITITPEIIDDLLAGKISYAKVLGCTTGPEEYLALEGVQLFEQGRWQDAKTMFAGAVSLESQSYLGHAGLGLVAMAEEQWDEAQAHLDRAYALNQIDTAVLCNLGEVGLQRGDTAGAERFLQESVALDPAHLDPYAIRARRMLDGLRG